MRIIAGSLGGRTFQSPHGHRTHPMSEKVRGGLFGALGDIKGLTVLDAFSGSGALAIEAISRGARSAVAIEVDKGAHEVIKTNLNELGITDRVTATRAFANAWSTRHQAESFDLVLLDPPYDAMPWRDLKVLPRHVISGGLLVLSWPGKEELPKFEGFDQVQTKNYGDAQLVFYRKVS
ncbi:MAG TPA: RsmD family RNA methyltransferase [Candidatus Saccharimonadales bacterium]|nr:RsmD family RNA methyltransferase [Candidatus Saccharimonadales bacterium]